MRTVRRLIEDVWNLGHLDVLPDLVADGYIGHLPIGDHYGPQGVRIDIAAYRAAVPDLAVTLDDLMSVGDQVVRRYRLCGTHCERFMVIAATGLAVELHAIAIDRMADGKLIESWVQIDPFPAIRGQPPT
jgi:predicted ester cyclase